MTIPWDALRDAARQARNRSHSPYSGFAVGAAALGSSGAIFSGTNIEVSSYGLTLCAERLAVFKAIEAGERSVTAIALIADTPTPCPPCGACRQVIHDFGPNAEILMEDASGSTTTTTIGELLPNAFTPEHFLHVAAIHARQLAQAEDD